VPMATLPLPSSIAAMRDWLEQHDLLNAAADAAGPDEVIEYGLVNA